MAVDVFRMFQLATQGFCCSQIMLILGLDELGKENPDLIKAMQGLCGGIGRSGKTCGAFTGGACLIGLNVGKGTPPENSHPKINRMINELLEWFEEAHGSIDCEGILDHSLGEGSEYPVQCGNIVATTFSKVNEILAAYAEDPESLDED
ncbi:C_GCAxxG_C_C family probable redox protein [Desulfosporosinus orientis DSM 765]|uniref:C_GCAxxG_C_C family probable redox protein n=1 Tax=Desulfosporosinus orientis (strain ATCC 19365 / DSM 765 / NCIMB 8382 / VKM B-1628 / Singapore I) TaxID=768706 RepID=G7WEP7_DESOD|nr:DV_1555 family C-GCAxxG-C-C protein [Desulfosporosinus orientis]AET66938.1 C_GCAxxG_C_C family probable redox protein [Desulfosporosinus orientis DSM 765]